MKKGNFENNWAIGQRLEMGSPAGNERFMRKRAGASDRWRWDEERCRFVACLSLPAFAKPLGRWLQAVEPINGR